MPEAMVVGCRETRAGEIDPSNADRLVDLAKTANAVLLGPGIIDEAPVAELRSELLARAPGPVFVLDASAFTSLRNAERIAATHGRQVIVSPHSGEMARFLQRSKETIEANPLASARTAASMLNAVVAMKGGRTNVVSPQNDELHFDHGPVALATSGSGDVLAGIIAGLAARGASILTATAWAVFLHGEAGRTWVKRNGELGLLAREIADEIPCSDAIPSNQLTTRREVTVNTDDESARQVIAGDLLDAKYCREVIKPSMISAVSTFS